MNNLLKFSYWPRYVARVLRMSAIYRGEKMDWKHHCSLPGGMRKPKEKPDCYNEEKENPVWQFSERYPWNMANRLSEFVYQDWDFCAIHPDEKTETVKLKPLPFHEQTIFKGDYVRVLIGRDAGKTGNVISVIKMRRLVLVGDLHCNMDRLEVGSNIYYRRLERPLRMDVDVALIDPSDGEICIVEWRENENGDKVRVSKRTGKIIPLPQSAFVTDDNIDPRTIKPGPKDCSENALLERTYDPGNLEKLSTFEEDLVKHYSLDENILKRPKRYWY